MPKRGLVVLVMGVSGSGKTTVGRLLGSELGFRFIDADDYHSEASKQKMQRGEPLDDADREPWLAELRGLVSAALARGEQAVLACSALKQRYREQLRVDPERVPVVYLRGSRSLIAGRLQGRVGHFATESLLDSQLAALEEPDDALTVDAGATPQDLVAQIAGALRPWMGG